MKLLNRLLTLGIGIGLCAVSATAMARPRHGRQNVEARRSFRQYDRNGDRVVSYGELHAHELEKCRAEVERDRYRTNERRWDLRGPGRRIVRRHAVIRARQEATERTRRIFFQADGNRDGVLTRAELVRSGVIEARPVYRFFQRRA
jgi:hypothetical protein